MPGYGRPIEFIEDEKRGLRRAVIEIDKVAHSYEERLGDEVNKRGLTMLAVVSLKLRELAEAK